MWRNSDTVTARLKTTNVNLIVKLQDRDTKLLLPGDHFCKIIVGQGPTLQTAFVVWQIKRSSLSKVKWWGHKASDQRFISTHLYGGNVFKI